MKNIFISILFLTTLVSCHKETKNNATIVKDCTGDYIRIDSKDYFICNDEMAINFKNNTQVYVEYNTVDKCDQPNDAICLMLHLSEGAIKITKIK